MARYKEYSYEQGKFIPIHFDKQILPGTFEFTLSYLIDDEIDLSFIDQRYKNDETGAPAYDPAILLKIILYAYSRVITLLTMLTNPGYAFSIFLKQQMWTYRIVALFPLMSSHIP